MVKLVLVRSVGCADCLNVETARYHEVVDVDPNRWLGLGDVLKWFFGLFKIHYCAGCAVRRSWLNRLFPFPYARQFSPAERAVFYRAQRERIKAYPYEALVEVGWGKRPKCVWVEGLKK